MKTRWCTLAAMALLVMILVACDAVSGVSLRISKGGSPPDFTRLVFFGEDDTDGGLQARGAALLLGQAHSINRSPPYDGGKYCNGPIWPEILAEMLRVTYVPKDNYAVGQATTGIANAMQSASGNIQTRDTGLLYQVRDHLRENPALSPRALYALWIGQSDYYYGTRYEDLAVDAVVAEAASNIEQAVRTLADAGAQYILVGTLVDMGSTPMPRLMGPEEAEALSSYAITLNEAISETVAVLRADLPERKLILADIYDLHSNALSDPASLGFSEGSEPCYPGYGDPCGNPEEHLYWNMNGRFTSAFHAVLANAFYRAIMEQAGR